MTYNKELELKKFIDDSLTEEDFELCEEYVSLGKEVEGKNFLDYLFLTKNYPEDKRCDEDYFSVVRSLWADYNSEAYNYNPPYPSFEAYMTSQITELKNTINQKEKATDYEHYFEDKKSEVISKIKELKDQGKSFEALDLEIGKEKPLKALKEELQEKYPDDEKALQFACMNVIHRWRREDRKPEPKKRVEVTGPIYDYDGKPTYHYTIDGVRSFETTDYSEVEEAIEKYK